MIHQVLDAFSIKRYEVDEYEADDIIGTAATNAAKEGFDVVVITGDKDLLQLVDDRVEVVLTKKAFLKWIAIIVKKWLNATGLNRNKLLI